MSYFKISMFLYKIYYSHSQKNWILLIWFLMNYYKLYNSEMMLAKIETKIGDIIQGIKTAI